MIAGPVGSGWSEPTGGYEHKVTVLSREEFDAIEFDAAYTGDHESAAVRMIELATTGVESDSMPRAEAFARAGEQWLLADDPAAAVSGFRKALADGGPVDVDVRVRLCRALLQLGEHDQAQALVDEMKSDGRNDARACESITELLLEYGDLPGALEWATAGVKIILADSGGPDSGGSDSGGPDSGGPDSGEPPGGESPGDPNADVNAGLASLLRLRYRIRNDLRLPEDEYDRMLNA